MKTRIPAVLITFALVCFALVQNAQAVVPPPDGGYPNFNTAEGQNALFSLTTGSANTAVGWSSLSSNAEGSFNTATGAGALLFNTADQNTAFGGAALLFNTTGHDNTAVGAAALLNNIEGDFNTASGERALHNNTTGDFNTATGRDALYSNTTGDSNTANGLGALFLNTEGGNNTAIGVNTLLANISGDNNTTLGRAAGSFINGSGNVCIGEGVSGETGVDDRTNIRNVNTLTQNYSAGVNDYVTVRLSDGRLGHTAVVSSQRYKEDIKPLDKTSQALHALKPVSFRLKKEFDPTQALGFGLIAEEVERVNPDLVYRNAQGQVESVRYENVNAMLLNEFLKEHRKNEDQEAAIARLEKQVDALTTGLQKVSAQLEASKPAPQVAENNR